jgi:hypothetical protein
MKSVNIDIGFYAKQKFAYGRFDWDNKKDSTADEANQNRNGITQLVKCQLMGERGCWVDLFFIIFYIIIDQN